MKEKGEMEGNTEGGGHSEKGAKVHLLPSPCDMKPLHSRLGYCGNKDLTFTVSCCILGVWHLLLHVLTTEKSKCSAHNQDG